MGADYLLLETQGNREKELTIIAELAAKHEGKVVLNLDTTKQNLPAILEICSKHKIFVVTHLNGRSPIDPSQLNPFYVANISVDNVRMGREIGQVLFRRMGGTGGIVALCGPQHFEQAVQRKAGLDSAIESNRRVALLDYHMTNWSLMEASEIVRFWLIRYGKALKGIWAANDDMALGALLTLRRYSLSGKVAITGFGAIPEAAEAVNNGEMEGTVSWEPFWRGGIGLSLGYSAYSEEIDWSKEPRERREFYGRCSLVTQENVETYLSTHVYRDPEIVWRDFWGGTSPVKQ
jgi:ribose transport system substrate-binding protein